MNISMYQASIPRLVHMLNNLSAIIDKAQAFTDAKKIGPDVLPSCRLIADMLPLTTQVQIACDTAKGAAGRLAGIEIPAFEDNEKTLADLKARIEKTVAFLTTVKAGQVDGSEGKDIVLKVAGKDMTFTGMQYLLARVIPNFYFHVSTAYDILRHNGVDIGKRDFLGNTST